MCRLCLAASIEHSDAPKVKCPFKDENYSCDMEILEREIKAVRDARRKKGKKLSHFQNYISHHPSHIYCQAPVPIPKSPIQVTGADNKIKWATTPTHPILLLVHL